MRINCLNIIQMYRLQLAKVNNAIDILRALDTFFTQSVFFLFPYSCFFIKVDFFRKQPVWAVSIMDDIDRKPTKPSVKRWVFYF